LLFGSSLTLSQPMSCSIPGGPCCASAS
jgi:hypothetical protein